MGTEIISGVQCTPLKIINHPLGNVQHGLKASDPGFRGFGEAYFSFVNSGAIKGWKKHKEMTLNFISASGAIRVVVYDDRLDSPSKGLFGEWKLSIQNYQRLTIPPMLWVAFQGVGKGQNLLLNIANIEHNPLESENCELQKFDYEWPNP